MGFANWECHGFDGVECGYVMKTNNNKNNNNSGIHALRIDREKEGYDGNLAGENAGEEPEDQHEEEGGEEEEGEADAEIENVD